MCGIAGIIGSPNDRALGERLLSALRHRGPDDEGIESPTPTVMLVHTRLSILDLSDAGHQPMADQPEGGINPNWIVFNGEIFNFKELQADLDRAGWPCRTQSDTEVILQSYRFWGPQCVERFRGMFAFCLVDTTTGVAHLYRDRLGIKPLYYYSAPNGACVFASELRAILALGPELVSPKVNPVALESYFAQGAVQGYGTLIDGIKLLKPGSYITIDLETGKEVAGKTYWQLPMTAVNGLSREAAVDQLSAQLHDVVKLRLISDVPLGLFLSGGIDSGALLAFASGVGPGSLRTISLGFDVDGFDETEEARATATAYGSTHTSLKITGHDVLDALPSVFEAMDQPTVDGMNTYVVSRAAKDAGLTVALSGLGGDELFGGYASFEDVPKAVAFRKRLRWLRLPRMAALLRKGRAGVKVIEMFRRGCDPLAMYLLRRELFMPLERRSLHALPRESDRTTGLGLDLVDDLQTRSTNFDELNRISFFEIELYMRHMLLRDADVFSMAAPIEYRVPFLDHQLVDLIFSFPGSWKKKDPRPKPLLLDTIRGTLPTGVWQRPKRGFTFPWASWFAPGGALEQVANRAVNSDQTWRRLAIDPRGVKKIWQMFAAGDTRISASQIMAFVALQNFADQHQLTAA
jgi:asparagine synthase (glutamine-hydrolysing)